MSIGPRPAFSPDTKYPKYAIHMDMDVDMEGVKKVILQKYATLGLNVSYKFLNFS